MTKQQDALEKLPAGKGSDAPGLTTRKDGGTQQTEGEEGEGNEEEEEEEEVEEVVEEDGDDSSEGSNVKALRARRTLSSTARLETSTPTTLPRRNCDESLMASAPLPLPMSRWARDALRLALTPSVVASTSKRSSALTSGT